MGVATFTARTSTVPVFEHVQLGQIAKVLIDW